MFKFTRTLRLLRALRLLAMTLIEPTCHCERSEAIPTKLLRIAILYLGGNQHVLSFFGNSGPKFQIILRLNPWRKVLKKSLCRKIVRINPYYGFRVSRATSFFSCSADDSEMPVI